MKIEIFLFFITYFLPLCILSSENLLETNIWNGTSFPNPQVDADYKKCNINQTSAICDPDNILSENERQNIIKHFEKLQQSTTNGSGDAFCEKHGIIGGIAIGKNFDGGNSETLMPQANSILRRWNLDPVCFKSFIIVLATIDRSVWIAKDLNMPLTSKELTEIFNEEKSTLRNGNYEEAILNMINGIETIHSKSLLDYLINICIFVIFISLHTWCFCFCGFCCCGKCGGDGGSSGGSHGGGGGTTYYAASSNDTGGGGGDSGGGGGGDY